MRAAPGARSDSFPSPRGSGRAPRAFGSAIYGDDLGLDQAAVVDVQEAEGPVRLAATVRRGPGIEDADAIGSLVEGDVGMPEHDQLRGREPAAEPGAPAYGLAALGPPRHRPPPQGECQGFPPPPASS